MNWKLLGKITITSALLVAVGIFTLPLNIITAGSPKPTSQPAMDMITKLQSGRATHGEPKQDDGRLFEGAPLSSEKNRSPARTTDQHIFDAIADATVLEGYPDFNTGGVPEMLAGYDEYMDPYGLIVRSLVKFDLSTLPPGQIITNATLNVYLVSSWDYPETSRTIQTYQITDDWSEDTVNWNNKPGYGSDYGSQDIVHGEWGLYEFDVTELVTAWYVGTYANYGIMLRGPEVSGLDASWRGFGTKESENTPQLIIDLGTSGDTPTTTLTPTTTSTQTVTLTPTPTLSLTPSPTPTQTSQSGLSYLPLIRRDKLPPTITPTPTNTPQPQPKLVLLYVDNDTGGQLCYEVLNTGIGKKCFSGGKHHYGDFPSGTYTWKASARCGSASDTEYFPSGEYIHQFKCTANTEMEFNFGSP